LIVLEDCIRRERDLTKNEEGEGKQCLRSVESLLTENCSSEAIDVLLKPGTSVVPVVVLASLCARFLKFGSNFLMGLHPMDLCKGWTKSIENYIIFV
jgi:hypothetical protein